MSAVAPKTPGQRRTQRARDVFAAQFPTPEARSAHYRTMAEKANAGRIVLSPDDVAALGRAYALLCELAARGKIATLPHPDASEE